MVHEPGSVEGVGVDDLRIPDGADAQHWAEMSREYVRLSGMRPPEGTADVRGCFLPAEARPLGGDPRDARAVPPVFVLAGMHRSATSLFGRFLMASGIDLGETLIGPLPSNPYGHFEDIRFVDLHEEALRRREAAVDPSGFNAAERSAAVEYLCERRAAGRAWGWKDPRTCFFLADWAELIPEATFLLLFREPLQVVDSMCRRKERDANTRAANSGALGAWIGHNRELLRFHKSRPERCVLIEVERAVENPERFTALLRKRTGFPFEEALFQRCFDSEILRRGRPAARPLSWRLRLQAQLVYVALRRRSVI